MQIINTLLVNSNNDDQHFEVLVKRKKKNDKNHDTFRNYVSTVAVQ